MSKELRPTSLKRSETERAMATVPCKSSDRPLHVVDVMTAFEALDGCAREFQARSPTAVDDDPAPRLTPLVMAALGRTGLAADALQYAPLFHDPDHPKYKGLVDGASGLTLGALVVFRAAERAGRRGADPLSALRQAQHVLVKYVSVLPQALLSPSVR